MKRLTKINENGKAYYPDCFTKCNGIGFSAKCDRCEISEKACEALAAYENTGLTPVQILELDAITEDAKKDAFIGGIELGIDWGFKDIPPEDIELYHQLIKERETKNLGR